jgi:hypothetical protein
MVMTFGSLHFVENNNRNSDLLFSTTAQPKEKEHIRISMLCSLDKYFIFKVFTDFKMFLNVLNIV